MIKRIIGTLAVLASLAVMTMVVLHRNEFSSMVFDGRPAGARAPRPAVPEEMPDSAASAVPAEADSLRLAE